MIHGQPRPAASPADILTMTADAARAARGRYYVQGSFSSREWGEPPYDPPWYVIDKTNGRPVAEYPTRPQAEADIWRRVAAHVIAVIRGTDTRTPDHG